MFVQTNGHQCQCQHQNEWMNINNAFAPQRKWSFKFPNLNFVVVCAPWRQFSACKRRRHPTAAAAAGCRCHTVLCPRLKMSMQINCILIQNIFIFRTTNDGNIILLHLSLTPSQSTRTVAMEKYCIQINSRGKSLYNLFVCNELEKWQSLIETSKMQRQQQQQPHENDFPFSINRDATIIFHLIISNLLSCSANKEGEFTACIGKSCQIEMDRINTSASISCILHSTCPLFDVHMWWWLHGGV